MQRFVMDASVALAWFLPGQEVHARIAAEVLRLLRETDARCIVPALWHYEVGARLIRARRRGEISAPALAQAAEDVGTLSLETHHIGIEVSQVVELAARYNVTGYDAIYLQLARSQAVALATADDGQIAAGRVHGVTLLGLDVST